MKALPLLTICVLLTGCPLVYSVKVKNETSFAISIGWPLVVEGTETIHSGSSGTIVWWDGACLRIDTQDSSKYYQSPEHISKDVVRSGRFSSIVEFVVVYRDDGLYFERKDGQVAAIPSKELCDDA